MKYFNVFTKHEYQVLDQTHTKWYRVGTLKETDQGTRYLRLFHQPSTTFYVLPKDREETDLPTIE